VPTVVVRESYCGLVIEGGGVTESSEKNQTPGVVSSQFSERDLNAHEFASVEVISISLRIAAGDRAWSRIDDQFLAIGAGD
jgi:ligand-binding sensor protein